MKKWIAGILAFALSATLAIAQTGTVRTQGNVTGGHATYWIAPGVVGDAGSAIAGNITSLGVTNNGGPGICLNSAPITGPYNQLCLTATTNGGTKISSYVFNGATSPGFTFDINGAAQGFLTVTGTPVTNNGAACFNGTTGTLKDCGAATVATSLTAPVLKANGAQTLSVSPTGNTATTLASLSVQGNTVSNTTREFLVNLGLTSGNGFGNSGTDKVTLYSGIVGNAGTTDIWSLNTLLTQASGSGVYNAQGFELDINNNNAHRGDADGGSGLVPPVTYGLSVTGASSFRITSGIGVFSASGRMFNRGIVFALDSISQATYQDLTSSTISLDVRGTHTYGLDLFNCTCSADIRLANLGTLVARNQGNTQDVTLLALDTSNNMLFGSTNFAGGIFTGGSLIPTTDNTKNLGSTTQRWEFGFFSAGVNIGGLANPQRLLELSAASGTGTIAARFTNPSTASNTTKFIANEYAGSDTVSTIKVAGVMQYSPVDANWIASDLVLQTRLADAVSEVVRFSSKGYIGFTGATPTITAGCSGAGSGVVGNNVSGTVTGSTAAATSCTLTFANSGFASAPNCVAMGQSSPLTGAATPGTGTLVVNFTSTSNYKWSYICPGL